MLKFSRYHFAAIVFGLKGAILTDVVTTVLALLFSFFADSFKYTQPDWVSTFATLAFTSIFSFLSGYLAFLLSIGGRKLLALQHTKYEPYIVVLLAILIANFILFGLTGFQWSSFHSLFFTTSIVSLFIGPKIYVSIWMKLTRLLSEPGSTLE